MSVPRWSRAAVGLGACAGFTLFAGCASSGTQGPRGDSTIASEYGAQPPSAATRVNKLTRADIEAAGTTDIAALIEPRLAGVRVSRRGGDYVVHIRGAASFQGNSEALVLIDGVEGTLGAVSVHDIESIEVLKDAAATIYGVRGANGVLLVTMRRR